MTMHRVSSSRRNLLKGAAAAGAGLIIGFRWTVPAQGAAAPVPAGALAPNAFVRVGTDSLVTVISKHTEFGQGIYTGLATLIAEELDADWAQIRVQTAPVDPALYGNLRIRNGNGFSQHTGGSLSMANSWEQMRTAGATARAMLVSAAAKTWGVPPSEIVIEKGVLRHPASGRSGGFGTFATRAASLPVPAKVALKDPKDFTFIGRTVPQIDSPAILDGSLRYGIDWHEPGTRIAVVLHPPRFGAVVQSFDATAARKLPGVTAVVPVSTGVAVVADTFWAAKRGRDALQVVWDESKAEKRSTDEIAAHYRTLGREPGKLALKAPVGDVEAALAGAARRISATFDFPYVTHAPMEPMAAVCKLTKTSCEIWSGTRNQMVDHENAVKITGLPPDRVQLHTVRGGGAFGKRGPGDAEYKAEVVEIAHALGGDGVPVKVIWTREDDIRAGKYRPMVHHAFDAALDQNGALVGWRQRIVGQAMLRNGAVDPPYDIPNFAVETHETQSPVTLSPLRSVDHTHTAFAAEAFLDEIAVATGADPVELRRKLLTKSPRDLGVLNLAAEKAGWGTPLPPGRGRGIALHAAMGSWAAQVAEVSVDASGQIKVHRIVCAVDCGIAVNPDIVRAQMEGGIAFGLSVAMHEAITLKNGRVEQSNFTDYRILRMAEMPQIEVHIVPSTVAPSGIGEVGVPPIAPAVANAVFAATGQRLRSLPFKLQGSTA